MEKVTLKHGNLSLRIRVFEREMEKVWKFENFQCFFVKKMEISKGGNFQPGNFSIFIVEANQIGKNSVLYVQ